MIKNILDWSSKGICVGRNDLNFFPETESSALANELPCRKLNCPVRKECRDWAIVFDEYGIWGGMTTKSRNNFSKKLSKIDPTRTIKQRLVKEAEIMGIIQGVWP